MTVCVTAGGVEEEEEEERNLAITVYRPAHDLYLPKKMIRIYKKVQRQQKQHPKCFVWHSVFPLKSN